MGKTIGLIIGVIVLVGATGAGAFYGGTVYQQQQQTNVRNTFFNGRGGAGGGGFGGGVFGTVKTVNGNTITVSTAQNVTTVTLSDSTVIMKSTTGTPADIQVGAQITVRGQRDSSGNVTATNVQLLPPGTTFGNRGGGGGADATPTP